MGLDAEMRCLATILPLCATPSTDVWAMTFEADETRWKVKYGARAARGSGQQNPQPSVSGMMATTALFIPSPPAPFKAEVEDEPHHMFKPEPEDDPHHMFEPEPEDDDLYDEDKDNMVHERDTDELQDEEDTDVLTKIPGQLNEPYTGLLSPRMSSTERDSDIFGS